VVFRGNDKALKWAVALSVATHALLLAMKFAAPDTPKWEPPSPVIMAVLVNAKSPTAPTKATVIAQNHLDGGGDLAEKGWMPSSPLERGETKLRVKASPSEGSDAKKIEAMEAEINQMMAAMKSDWKTKSSDKPQSMKAEPSEAEKIALELAARIDKQASAYASRPKKTFVGLQAKRSDLAVWIESWQRKVEQLGNAFYPEEAQGRVRGTLILTAGIGKDGRLDSVRIDKSSGYKLLDESAQRILTLAAPFEAFDPAMASKVDILYITRQWRFGPSGLERLESSSPP
jgi:protein TonB